MARLQPAEVEEAVPEDPCNSANANANCSWGFLAGADAFKVESVEHRSELNLGKYVSEFVHHAALILTCRMFSTK